MSVEVRKDDSPEDIKRCLSCKRPACTNCLGAQPHPNRVAKKQAAWMEKLMALSEEALTDKELARRIGVSPCTIAKLRKQAGIPSRREARRERAESV